MPDVRMMLLKDIRDSRFFFTTHITTPKGEQLKANPQAALLFYWRTLNRQVRVRGAVELLSEAAADMAWLNRGTRAFKLNDWSWPQSQPSQSFEELLKRRKQMEERFPGEVPRPPSWSGYLLTPLSIEFFYARASALHERLKFLRAKSDQPWRTQRLVP
jgi:pyridoxamine 5'-phosphate oxidase